ncbi:MULTISPECIES: hypothetical protein [Rhodococcus]|uniref:hypothetical protein n=1 Tax=Rhodococcus TaxID=1827 RepID=UPI001E5E3EE7|nr:hypothetical protein [Rhodococcus pyridinivorans]MCD2119433.1 hypothetical protein [Rhodococcus pyridinivorans]MCZ4628334.1 hypothetical protein [Rhodococcus pyridinivorans]MCZ4649599.1 hypothetical protein [Rhodococcus pyridinivorans]MDJ0483681.1 hypothetical protein [Rhodococcus pyridinivorans]MDV7255668.1 hypothetical protein [Rhodococcus pyridinivorans]
MAIQRGRKESTRQRQRRAVELRTKGKTYEQIAEQCGYSTRGAAYRAVMGMLNRQESASAGELRRLEDARLDLLTRRLYAELEVLNPGDDPGAVVRIVDGLMRLGESRRRLHSVDLVKPPVVVDVHAQAELEDVKADMRRLLGIDPPVVIEEDDDERWDEDRNAENHTAADEEPDDPVPPTLPAPLEPAPAPKTPRCSRCGSPLQGAAATGSVVCAGCRRGAW